MRRRTALALTAGLAAVVALVLFAAFALIGGLQSLTSQLPWGLGQSCRAQPAPATVAAATATGATAPGDPVRLTPTRMANAATIAAVGIRRGLPSRAVVVALATAFQESGLDNLPEGDRDSVGLFQQRPSQGWGRPDQLANPRFASDAFYTALLKVRGWQQLRVTDAAQAVQRSADPEAYERWAKPADVLSRAFSGDTSSAVACTVRPAPSASGTDATTGLSTGLRQDWGDARASTSATASGLELTVRDVRSGWQYAHWLVAHAAEHSVERVSFEGLQWTGRSGEWRRDGRSADDARTSTGTHRVRADVAAR